MADAGVGATYIWTVTGGSIDSGQDTTEITWTAGAAGTANISVEIQDAAQALLCSDDVDVTVNALPNCTITPSASSVCANATGLTASVADAGAGAAYTWAVTGGSIDSGQGTTEITWTAGAAGSATISVEITDENGCQCMDDVDVTVNALPDCTITPSASLVCANATGLTASVADAGAGAAYTWAVTGGSIDSGQGTTEITWTAGAAGSATISVEITDENGCQCMDEVMVEIEDCSTAIPTLSEWGMIIMSLILAGSAIWMMRRRGIA